MASTLQIRSLPRANAQAPTSSERACTPGNHELQEKEELVRQTGITLKQLNTFFANTRKRTWAAMWRERQAGGHNSAPPDALHATTHLPRPSKRSRQTTDSGSESSAPCVRMNPAALYSFAHALVLTDSTFFCHPSSPVLLHLYQRQLARVHVGTKITSPPIALFQQDISV